MASVSIDIADKTTLDAVNSKLGTTSDSGGSASAGSAMGKLNKLISNSTQEATVISGITDRLGLPTDTATSTVFGGMNELLSRVSVIRKIQRGTATMSSTAGTTINFPTALTNLDKCLVLLNGSEIRSGDNYSTLPYLDSLSATSMVIKKGNGQHNYDFSWQVIEFY